MNSNDSVTNGINTNGINRIPFDIIYTVYFYITDYTTLNNFWYLCPEFTAMYMKRYNRTYVHKFRVLFHDIFTFLHRLPDQNSGESDIYFYELVTTQSHSTLDRSILRKDIGFIYNMYKRFLIYYLTPDLFNQYVIQSSTKMASVIMLQGTHVINQITSLQFNCNKIKITARYNDINTALSTVLQNYAKHDHDWIHYQIQCFRNLLSAHFFE